MNYEEALAYIHSIQWRGTRLGLDRVNELLDRLNHPERKLRFIHIAGTNGKGSTAAMTASVLEKAGYQVGLYVSPYINRFNERIQLNHTEISDEELTQITAEIKPLADKMSDPPTEFELITVIGFVYFARHNCDIVVLEVGMGGRLDATNVIPAPEVAVIVNIGYDHTKELGDTFAKIAAEKAGIIKTGTKVVSYGRNPESDAVIAEICRERNVPLMMADHDRVTNVRADLDALTLDYAPYKDLKVSLVGNYQRYNVAVVLKILETLQKNGWHISEQDIREGLSVVRWPSRFEVLNREPVFVADGGHNPQGIVATTTSLREHFPNRKIVFLMGVMADKDVANMLQYLAPLAERFVAIRPNNPRSMPAETLASKLRELGCVAEAAESIPAGVSKVLAYAGKDGICCAIGSLYMQGEVRDCFPNK